MYSARSLAAMAAAAADRCASAKRVSGAETPDRVSDADTISTAADDRLKQKSGCPLLVVICSSLAFITCSSPILSIDSASLDSIELVTFARSETSRDWKFLCSIVVIKKGRQGNAVGAAPSHQHASE